VKPSYGLTDGQVEQMISESIDQAEADFAKRQLAEARVDADAILAATEKARQHEAWEEADDQERRDILAAERGLREIYHTGDHLAVREHIDRLNQATMRLAERMMTSVVRTAATDPKLSDS
jgi:molecular chaperone DnaK (HSP70)